MAYRIWYGQEVQTATISVPSAISYTLLALSTLRFTEDLKMDMMGRVGLVEIPVLIAPDQKVWMDRMIKEGKIAIPPGGTLEKGSLYSMFIRMLLHNAMEEQKRQEALEAADEDDE
ncbi:MAG TPA: hypothetical protein VEI50_07675 [Nitrospiraceae bacterium]|nr:hypothetical protein [Nitrospiraceae bacterium]